MGQTQHTVGTANVRASCMLLLLTGNVGAPGTGANIFRGHDNVQGATDVGLDIVTLPFYYGLVEGAWKHWSRVWEVDYNYLRRTLRRQEDDEDARHPADALVRRRTAAEGPGRPEGQRPGDVRAGSRQQQHHPHPGVDEGIEGARSAGGRRSASHHLGFAGRASRAQGGHVSPAGRHAVRVQRFARGVQPRAAVGRADRQADLRVEGRPRGHVPHRQEARLRRPDVQEHQGREQPAGGRGHSSRNESRQLLHRLLRPVAGAPEVAHGPPGRFRHAHPDAPTTGPNKGDYYGLPWPCWGTPEVKHPGTPLLYNTNLAVMDGGGCFRARFGVEREEKKPDGTTGRSACWPTAPIPRIRRSRTAIPNSPSACSRSSAGTRT